MSYLVTVLSRLGKDEKEKKKMQDGRLKLKQSDEQMVDWFSLAQCWRFSSCHCVTALTRAAMVLLGLHP